MEQGLKTHAVILIVDDGHGQSQQKQGQGIDHGVFRSQEEPRQRPAHHVPHGNVEQRNGEYEGPNDPALHRFVFLFCCIHRGNSLGRRFPFGLLERRAIARLLHGGDDLPAVYGLVVIGHHHTVFQQIDIAVLHTVQVSYAFLYPRLAGSTGHACDIVLFLHFLKPPLPESRTPIRGIGLSGSQYSPVKRACIVHSEILFAQMGEFFRVTIQNFLQGDAAHGLLCSGLYQIVAVPQHQLDVHPHAAGGVGMGILMEQGLVPLHRSIGVQQRDLAGLFRKRGAWVPPHAGEQPAFPQGGHELAHIGWVGLDTLRNLFAGEYLFRVQSNESQNMNGVTELGRVFHFMIPHFSLMLVLL